MNMTEFVDQFRGPRPGGPDGVAAAMARQETAEEAQRQRAAAAAEDRAETQRMALYTAGVTPDDIARARQDYADAEDRVADLRGQLERAEAVLRSRKATREDVLARMDTACSMASRSAVPGDLLAPAKAAMADWAQAADTDAERRLTARTGATLRRMQDEAFARELDRRDTARSGYGGGTITRTGPGAFRVLG